ncbi:MAG: DUF4124 domain-containing protein [Pseudomonadota bacterium]
MKHAVSCVLLTFGLILFYGPIHAKVYKWVDEGGITRFSDTPPPGVVDNTPAQTDTPAEKETDPYGPDLDPINVTFDLSGEVRDAKGNLVNGVTMTILEHHPRPDTIGFKEVRKKQTVNERFHIACSGCPIHRLRFRAPGYLSEEYTIKATGAEEQRLQRQFVATAYGVNSPGALDPITIRRNDIVIVLQSEDSVVRLHRVEFRLSATSAGPFIVLAGPPETPKETSYRHALEQMSAATKTGSPYGMVLLSTGNMPFDHFASAGKKNTLHTLGTPLYLEIKEIDGGFVTATPATGPYRKRFDSLTEAPASGYRPQLTVSTSNTDGVFFYFKFGSVYGKGHLYCPVYMSINSNGLLDTQVQLFLNPTGSRNLKSRI